MAKTFNEALDELNELIIMRQSPNEAYSSDEMEQMIKNKMMEVADIKYSYFHSDVVCSYQVGMRDMYNLMSKLIVTEP